MDIILDNINFTFVRYACYAVFGIAIVIALLIRSANNRYRQRIKSGRDYNCLTVKLAYENSDAAEPKRKPASNLLCKHTVNDDGFTSIVSIRRDAD